MIIQPERKPQKPISLIIAAVNHKMDYTIQDDSKNEEGLYKTKASVIFQKLYTQNNNGHHMDENCLKREILSKQEDVRERHFLGELDHPTEVEDSSRMMTVTLERAAFVVTKLEIDNKYVVGEIESLYTPKGLLLRHLLIDNIKTGVSIRATTEQDLVYDNEYYQKVNDFHLVCYDAVHNPAFNDAYVTSLLSSVYRFNPVEINTLMKKNEPTGELLTLSKSELKSLVSSMVSTVIKDYYPLIKK